MTVQYVGDSHVYIFRWQGIGGIQKYAVVARTYPTKHDKKHHVFVNNYTNMATTFSVGWSTCLGCCVPIPFGPPPTPNPAVRPTFVWLDDAGGKGILCQLLLDLKTESWPVYRA